MNTATAANAMEPRKLDIRRNRVVSVNAARLDHSVIVGPLTAISDLLFLDEALGCARFSVIP